MFINGEKKENNGIGAIHNKKRNIYKRELCITRGRRINPVSGSDDPGV